MQDSAVAASVRCWPFTGFGVGGGSRLPQQLRGDELVAHVLTSST
jgi:hypothetical protein